MISVLLRYTGGDSMKDVFVRSKSDKFGEVVRLYTHMPGGSHSQYVVIAPDGRVKPVEQKTYPPTKRGHWCITDYRLSQDKTTRDWNARISLIDCADTSKVKNFDVNTKVKQRSYAEQHAKAEAERLAYNAGYKRIVKKEEITWRKPRMWK